MQTVIRVVALVVTLLATSSASMGFLPYAIAASLSTFRFAAYCSRLRPRHFANAV
jgi:hypothetical protein